MNRELKAELMAEILDEYFGIESTDTEKLADAYEAIEANREYSYVRQTPTRPDPKPDPFVEIDSDYREAPIGPQGYRYAGKRRKDYGGWIHTFTLIQ